MIDKILLAPYYCTLKIRHLLYNKGIKKSYPAEVPTISVGNITVGGTGKTPHTEMIIRLLTESEAFGNKSIAVLSRGYRRKSRGFQQVVCGKDVELSGDEPLQMKNKFPDVTVAVDKSRIEGCDFLCHPEKLQTSKKGKKCQHKSFGPADIIILDDAFQYRKLNASLSIVLVDYNRPVFKDRLLPMGRLRDLPGRAGAADIIIITKCPNYLDEWEKEQWAANLKIKGFNPEKCEGTGAGGKKQKLFFTTIDYDTPMQVFPEGDQRYVYSRRAIVFSGIANDKPLINYLSDTYKIYDHIAFGDHHKFSASDYMQIKRSSDSMPTAVIMTTEKDAQRVCGDKKVPETLKSKMFQVPIKVSFLSETEKEVFASSVFEIAGGKLQ